MKRPITIAYSPDTDDAFMVHALREKLCPWGPYQFEFISADIQELNEKALHGIYDLTAISLAAYPGIADDYLLMTIGASIGDQFGPAVVTKPDSAFSSLSALRGRRIAIPGKNTSAFYAARDLIGTFEEVPLYFKDIAPAVANGEVDAGILIHELQLDCEAHGLQKIADLGSAWYDRHCLPLPLGANAIRRALGKEVIEDISRLLKDSIEYGLKTRSETLKAALRSSGAHLSQDLGDRYIEMYVNQHSLGFDPKVRLAMKKLLSSGVSQGLCKPISFDHCLAEV